MTKVFAINVSLFFFEVFPSEKEAIANCPGLEIAEGDWLFFDHSGAPLEAHFSIPAYVDTDRGVYGNGTYSLRKGHGKTLTDHLFDLCLEHDTIRFGTEEGLQAYYGDDPTD